MIQRAIQWLRRNPRLAGLSANVLGTLLLLAAGGFETGRNYVTQGKLPYPWLGSLCYWVGLLILLLGFVLQWISAYGERQRPPPTS
jgi:hypothetical protein